MKTNKLITFLFALVVGISLTSCVEDGDFTVPEALGAEENAALQQLLNSGASEVSISSLKGLFVNGQVTEITSDIMVKGYVTSSDRTGNFYKEFFIQDKAENPTAAIKIATELTDNYNKFNTGREVYINLKGLFIGEIRSNDGVITIGGSKNDDNEVENLSLNQTEKHILRSATTNAIVPLKLGISELNKDKIGVFVEVTDVYFKDDAVGKTFVDPSARFDTQRMFEGCSGFGTIDFILETSAFADFKFKIIPSGGGTIKGIINNTYDGRNLVLVLNDSSDVNLGGDKCKPLDITTFNEYYSDEFNDLSNWTDYSIIGSQTWRLSRANRGNPGTAAEISGYSRGAKTNEDWLVSNAINITGVSSAFLIFDNLKRYGGNDLEVFYSTDYTSGNPTTNGTWKKLSAVIDGDEGSWTSWTSSGALDVSSGIGGDIYIAFKYTSDTSAASTSRVDNLKILTK